MRIFFVFLCIPLCLFILSCSQQPPVEKEIVESSTPAMQSSQGSNLGSSHQEIAQLDQAGSSSAVPAKDASHPEIPQPANITPPMEASPGYRIASAFNRGSGATAFFQVPESWQDAPVRSSMRLSQITIPAAEGDPEPGEMAIFGPIGGSVQANIDRWIDQFTQPDGSSSKDKATIEEFQGKNYSISMVDLSGTMSAMSMPTMPAQNEKTGWRVLGAIIQTPEGPWYLKATGPEKTLAQARDAFIAMSKSMVLFAP